jgi:hypothetical protein
MDRKFRYPTFSIIRNLLAGDQHIQYKCDHVNGYRRAQVKAVNDHPEIDPVLLGHSLCNDFQFAVDYGFLGVQFMHYRAAHTYLTPYDLDSVMHYPSNQAVNNPGCTPETPVNCVLLNAAGGYIHQNRVPSAGDLHGVRTMYPWRG